MTKKFFMLLTLVLLASTLAMAQTPEATAAGARSPDHQRFRNGHRFRPLRPGTGQGRGIVRGRHGAQPRCCGGDPLCPPAGPGSDRVARALYPCCHLGWILKSAKKFSKRAVDSAPLLRVLLYANVLVQLPLPTRGTGS